jgi:hypothetical protein
MKKRCITIFRNFSTIFNTELESFEFALAVEICGLFQSNTNSFQNLKVLKLNASFLLVFMVKQIYHRVN